MKVLPFKIKAKYFFNAFATKVAAPIILLLITFFSQAINASEFSTQIKTASLDKYDGWYQLKANVDYKLSPTASEAIQSSIPLFWSLKIELKKIQLIWNKTLLNREYRYKIRYHALLNSYSVTNENINKIRHFNSLTAALEAISRIRNLKIIKISEIKKNTAYQVAIKLQFDKEALPLPLRPVAYLYSDWDLSSEWHLWTLEP